MATVLGMGESRWKSSSARGIASCSTFGRDVSGVSPMLCGGKDYAVGTAWPPMKGCWWSAWCRVASLRGGVGVSLGVKVLMASLWS